MRDAGCFSRDIAVGGIFLAVAFMMSSADAAVDVPITVTDHANVGHVGAPVSGGVPFPKGYPNRRISTSSNWWIPRASP
jgi:hypothetical protein